VTSPDIIAALPIEHYSRRQVADILGISYHNVPNLKRTGTIGNDGHRHFLKPIRKGTYTRDALVRYMRKKIRL
jgi:hypothetical protein